MQLILEADGRAFPPRLDHQPIFYPVLNFPYAQQIAQGWNTKDIASDYCGFVTRFHIDQAYADTFNTQVVGEKIHQEFWVPAAELDTFNQHIQDRIQMVAAYYGDQFSGAKFATIPDLTLTEQLLHLHSLPADALSKTLAENQHAVMLNYPYWRQNNFADHLTPEQKATTLNRIATLWEEQFPTLALFEDS